MAASFFVGRSGPPSWRPLFLLGALGRHHGCLFFCRALWTALLSRRLFGRETLWAHEIRNETGEVMGHAREV